MSRSLILIVLGVLVALTPFSGVPQSIMVWVVPPLGVLVALIGLSYKGKMPQKFASFVQPNDVHDGA